MTAYNGSFVRPLHGKGNELGLIHEQADQHIQGGISGQHYHISHALLAQLLSLATNTQLCAPIITADHTLIVSNGGDVVIEGFIIPSGAIVPDTL